MRALIEKNMIRTRLPVYVVIAAGAQTIVAFACLCVWGAWAGWGVFPNSLILSSIVFGPFVAVSIVSTLGLWKGKKYGWYAGVFGDGLTCLMLFLIAHPLYFCAPPLLVIALLLTSKVRKFHLLSFPDNGLSILR
jgi:hypothetical protein